MRPTIAVLSTENLFHNLKVIKNFAPKSKIIAMLKANAYGHGIRSVALRIHDKVDMIGVSSIDEAMILRKINIKSKIILMEGLFHQHEVITASAEEFDVVIHSSEQLKWLENTSYLPNPLNIWIKIDTGMGRLGFCMDYDEEINHIESVYNRLYENNNIKKPIGIISHFACSDEQNHPLNQKQINNFKKICNIFELRNQNIIKSFCNSSGIINFSEEHYDFVRPGLMLYGVSPIENLSPKHLNLKPVMHLQSQILTIKTIKKNNCIGYGATTICDEDIKIAIIPVGYGDGYSRTFMSGTPVLINNKICQLFGRVSMDMITVNINNCEEAKIGDTVVLFGENLSINEIEKYSSCAPWDLLTSLQSRVSFQWTKY